MGRNLTINWLARSGILYLSKREDLAKLRSEVVVSELIYSLDVELSAK